MEAALHIANIQCFMSSYSVNVQTKHCVCAVSMIQHSKRPQPKLSAAENVCRLGFFKS